MFVRWDVSSLLAVFSAFYEPRVGFWLRAELCYCPRPLDERPPGPHAPFSALGGVGCLCYYHCRLHLLFKKGVARTFIFYPDFYYGGIFNYLFRTVFRKKHLQNSQPAVL